jgi:Aldo/keto reductase family
VQYTSNFKQADPSVEQKINFVGNSAKSMRVSVDASLRKLCTSYIDILYVHWWDYETGVKEVMDSFHTLVLSKRLFISCFLSPPSTSPHLLIIALNTCMLSFQGFSVRSLQ